MSLRNAPVELSAAERQLPPAPINIVVVSALSEYEPWARRNPDLDAVPYVVGKPITVPHIDNAYVERSVHPIIEWALVEMGLKVAKADGLVHLEQWPAST